jgi:hypothetical protein
VTDAQPTPWRPGVSVRWVAHAREREALLAASSLPCVSVDAVLRANLTVAENIAWVPMFLQGLDRASGLVRAAALLQDAQASHLASLRPAQLTPEDRFVAVLLQILAKPPVGEWLLDRPALLLPNVHYPVHLAELLGRLKPHFQACTIVDYAWNAPLYPS